MTTLRTKILANKSDIIWRLIAILYTLYLVHLHFIRLNDFNLWSDECFSVNLARQGFWGMIDGTANDVHPPLYYIVIIILNKILGESGFSLHLSAFIFYIASLIFILTVIWKNFGKEVSLLMITLCSLTTTSIRYNVEVRMYSLAFFMCMLAFWGLYVIINDSTKYSGYIYLIIGSLGAAYSHYYGLFSVFYLYITLFILVLIKKVPVKNLIITYIITVLGYLPWLSKLITTFSTTSQSYWMTDYSHFTDCIQSFYPYPIDAISYFMFLLTIVVVLYSIYTDFKNKEINDFKLSSTTLWMICGMFAIFATILTGILVSEFIHPSFVTRYLYPITSACWLILCVGLSKVTIRNTYHIGKIFLLVLVVFCFIIYKPIYNYYYTSETNEEILFTNTLSEMNSLITPNDIFLTDYLHYEITIIGTYFPENEHYLIDSSFDSFQDGIQYWYLSTNVLSDDFIDMFTRNGYTCDQIIENGSLGTLPTHFYRLAKNNQN